MKLLFLIIFATVTVLLVQKSVEALNWQRDPSAEQSLSAYNYHHKFGIAEASRIKEAEARKPEIGPDINAHRIRGFVRRGVTDITPDYPGTFPYQAGLDIFLTNGLSSVCSAALISSKRLVTAAHCWYDGVHQAEYFTVVLKTIRLYDHAFRFKTSNVTMHEQWNPRFIGYDIAMISIRELSLSYICNPADLPLGFEGESFKGATVIAGGYELRVDDFGTRINRYLRYFMLNVTDHVTCKSYFKEVERENICAIGRGGKNICDGSSGGPLVVKIKNVPTLIGITSLVTDKTCADGVPMVFTRVTSYLGWIQKFL